MMGSFLSRVSIMIFGYAYPAYECYKSVEMNKPDIERLRFWCQYWILVAVLTVFERFGDASISWLPMYSEVKLAFFIYLWYPRANGTTYVYETFFRPLVAKHETEIDRSLLELRTRTGDVAVLYWQKAVRYGQTRIFEVVAYVTSQSKSEPQSIRANTVQVSSPVQQQQIDQTSNLPQQKRSPKPPLPPAAPTRSRLQGRLKSSYIASPAKPQTSSDNTTVANHSSEELEMHVDTVNASSKPDGSNSSPKETVRGESASRTRVKLRKRPGIHAAQSS